MLIIQKLLIFIKRDILVEEGSILDRRKNLCTTEIVANPELDYFTYT